YLEIDGQPQRVDGDQVLLIGRQGLDQQIAAAVAGAYRVVVQLDGHIGHAVGGHDGEAVVDAPAGKDAAVHADQRAAGAQVGGAAAAVGIHPHTIFAAAAA